MTLTFTKMHGLGNDYLFIDGSQYPVDNPTELACRMSHRYLGAGADGIIVVLPGREGEFAMRIFNADGSEAKTCGNGIRCFAKYVYERGLTNKTAFTIDTLGGPNKVELDVSRGKVNTVRSNMGKPRFERAEIPMEGPSGQVIEEPLDLGGQIVHVTCVNIGNPHAVVFVGDATKAPVTELGPRIERHPAFPNRINAEFVSIRDKENIDMRIWERGSGITMASGSGSCGAALASMLTGRVPNSRLKVHLVYGALTVEWVPNGGVYQEGPAEEVYEGTWLSDGRGA